jgi:glucoside 3-dehydrogenase (cytochrome c) hitch-hiker subunit
MVRRQALKLLASAAALPAAHSNFYNLLRGIHASLQTGEAHKTLDAHQHATVSAMADLIIPRTATPGAVDARVPEFIDLILSDWSDDRSRASFLHGLAAVNELSQQSFGKDFVASSPQQQGEILRLLGEEMARDAHKIAANPRGSRGGLPEPHGNFYYTFRQLVLTGYFTSEVGAAQQLHFQVIPEHLDACAALAKEKSAPEKPMAEKSPAEK